MFIRIGGVPGVGKTTIIKCIVDAGSKLNLPITSIKGGDYLLKLAGVSSYDELRNIPESDRAKLRPEMLRLMYKEDEKDPTTLRLRDAHFSLLQSEDNSFTIFPAQEEDIKQMLSMVVVTASSETIMHRRGIDKNYRPDRLREIKLITLEQETEISTALNQSKQYGARLYLLDNDRCLTDTCIQLVRDIIPQNYGGINLEAAILCPNGKECLKYSY